MALPVPTTSGKNARCCFARKDLQPEGGSKVRDIPIVTKDAKGKDKGNGKEATRSRGSWLRQCRRSWKGVWLRSFVKICRPCVRIRHEGYPTK